MINKVTSELKNYFIDNLPMDSKVKFLNKYFLFKNNLTSKENSEDIYNPNMEDVIYDLYDEKGFDAFRAKYGFKNVMEYYRAGEYWLGGKLCKKEVLHLMSNKDCDDIISDSAIPYIENRFIMDMYAYDVNNDDSNECIDDYTEMFENCINFAEYAVKNNFITKKYRWVCNCLDGGYKEESRERFDTQKECYNDMRNAALEKMKWNTEYDEDFNDGDCIGYEVYFEKDKIIHESYSGKYVYEIVETY